MRFGILASILALTTLAVAEEVTKAYVDIDAVTSSDELVAVDGFRAAGQPDADAFALVAEAGYAAVIDLRGEQENRGLDEAAVLQELGLDYVELPLSSPDAISFENAAKLDEILSGYTEPVLIHCGSSNRVGALLALRKSMHGASDDAAVEYGRDAGLTGLEPVVRSRLSEKE
ncbi:MAG: fused DSP-PTPase phosphatase/NAD kinase-like protein [Woeseiaceae bacterium]